MLTGVISTLLIPETNQKSLETLSNERQDRFFRFLGEYGSARYVNSCLDVTNT